MIDKPVAVDGTRETARFSGLRFDDFRRMATDTSLSPYEKIGFPDGFRDGFEPAIVADIIAKVPALQETGRKVLDVGPGCTEVPKLMIQHCVEREHSLFLLDAQEMLDLLPNGNGVTKIDGRFPDRKAVLQEMVGDGLDGIIAYSVLQHVFLEANPFVFVDELLSMLRPGGVLLLGDIPNVSKRHRFLSGTAGVEYHKAYFRTDEPPRIPLHEIESGRINDSVIIGLMSRARTAGFDAYVLPQPDALPMSNRREDMQIWRPQ